MAGTLNSSAPNTQITPTTQFVDGWSIIQTLGEGAYGEVKLLINERSQQALAMKIIDMRANQDEEALKSVQREIMIMKLLNHENVIKCFGDRHEEDICYIFLEYAEGGELFDRIEPDVGMKPEVAQFFFRQLIAGVEYLHSRGVAHRDLKPENLLISKNDRLKISDFGLATVFRHKGKERLCKTRCGTLPYVAPEVLIRNYNAEPADVWSCGVILVALLAGELPWDSPSVTCSQFLLWKEKQNLDKTPWNKIEIVAFSVVKSILQCSVEQRITLLKIRSSRWFIRDFRKKTQLMRMDSGDSQPKKKKLMFELGEPCNSGVSSTQPENVEGLTRTPTPPDCDEFRVSINNTSFSQPANLSSLLIGTQSQLTPENANPLQRLVRRMTRFCVQITLEKIIEEICEACKKCGCSAKVIPPAQITISCVDKRKSKLTFKANIYPMDQVQLVDFRLSQGDGLEFKRKFQALRAKLSGIIWKDSVQWLQEKGLVAPLRFENLSLNQ